MSERRRGRRGRGLDAIFDTGDLSLDEDPSVKDDEDPPRRSQPSEPEADVTPGRSSYGEEERAPRTSTDPANSGSARGPATGDRGGGDEASYDSETRVDSDAGGSWVSARDPHSPGSEPIRGRYNHLDLPDPDLPRGDRPTSDRRAPGRPSGSLGQPRTLLQKGFYLELEQDQMLDQIRSSLKSTGFTPDRSAIVRAAVESFYRLDPAEQEEMVRRLK